MNFNLDCGRVERERERVYIKGSDCFVLHNLADGIICSGLLYFDSVGNLSLGFNRHHNFGCDAITIENYSLPLSEYFVLVNTIILYLTISL